MHHTDTVWPFARWTNGPVINTRKCKRGLLSKTTFGSLVVAFLGAWSGTIAAQQIQMITPAEGSIVAGDVLLAAAEVLPSISPSQVSSVRFEYSADGVAWNSIGTVDLFGGGLVERSPAEWETNWDTTSLSRGNYLLRARFDLLNGNVLTTELRQVYVSTPPTAVIVGEPVGSMGGGAQFNFDGASSFEPGGSIVAWNWYFGDGTSATGPVVTHAYPTEGIYTVSLTVEDNGGARSSQYADVYAFLAAPALRPPARCMAKSIALRTNGVALGPTGDAKKPWYEVSIEKTVNNAKTKFGIDGIALGPLDGNPLNKNYNGEKLFTGIAFEIVAEVDGAPAKCAEIQIVKGTYDVFSPYFSNRQTGARNCLDMPGGTLAGPANNRSCIYYSSWTGDNADFDQDGAIDLDLSDNKKCGSFSGKWDNTKKICVQAIFPVGMNQYAPDESEKGEQAYTQPTDKLKVHLDNKIIWYDAPHSGPDDSNGTTGKLAFVAIIRGTDNKYCYASFAISYERKAGKDAESISEPVKACNVDKSKVPGLK